MLTRIPIRVPLTMAKEHPLCVHCKYYMPPPPVQHNDKKKGLCQKSGTMHVVDGEVEYMSVSIVREFDCRGEWYEPNDEVLINPPVSDIFP